MLSLAQAVLEHESPTLAWASGSDAWVFAALAQGTLRRFLAKQTLMLSLAQALIYTFLGTVLWCVDPNALMHLRRASCA